MLVETRASAPTLLTWLSKLLDKEDEDSTSLKVFLFDFSSSFVVLFNLII